MSKTTSHRRIGFGGALLLLFIGLKLTGHISWSWVWVLAPCWLPVGGAIATIMIVVLVAWVADSVSLWGNRRRRAKKVRQ